MGSELISVIVPVYNAEKYLRACLDSLRQQRYSAIEVWMVDDGSTDGSGAICDEYEAADSRFHAVHQQNAGVSAARNAGIRMAGGKYIGFIDSDDWIEPEFYETLAGLFDGGHEHVLLLPGRRKTVPAHGKDGGGGLPGGRCPGVYCGR